MATNSYNFQYDLALKCVLDEITQIASNACETEVAIICLREEKQYCIKSQLGILDANSIPLFASWIDAIEFNTTFVINDTAVDPVYKSNPSVTSGPQIKFCAGTPIINSAGDVIGAICIIDFVPKQITDKKVEILKNLAKIAVGVIELNRKRSRKPKDGVHKPKLMPICYSCKSLRKDQGEWQLLEKFIEAELGIKFSHGICEKCSESVG